MKVSTLATVPVKPVCALANVKVTVTPSAANTASVGLVLPMK